LIDGYIVHQPIDIEALCAERGLRITEQRRVIAKVLSESTDHPDVEKLHERAAQLDPGISIATVYRTVRLFEEAGILDRHDFGDGRARYEAAPEAHHDHMIDVETGKVIEFVDPELESLQRQVAERLGFRLVDHRMELFGVRVERGGGGKEERSQPRRTAPERYRRSAGFASSCGWAPSPRFSCFASCCMACGGWSARAASGHAASWRAWPGS